MPRRGENIYKRNDGRWEGRVLKPDGKYFYVYAKTYKEVKEKKNNYQENCSDPAPFEPKSVPELFENWLNFDVYNQVKLTTYGSYVSCMQKYIIPFYKKLKDNQITEFSVAQFVKSISSNNKLAKSYQRKILVVFKTALKEILKESDNCHTILNAIKLPKTDNSPVQVYSISEQRLVENAVINSDNKTAYGIILCFYTGIRLGELCALKWSDIDFEAGTMTISRTVTRVKNTRKGEKKTMLHVGTPKSRKSVRSIPIPEFILKFSEKYVTHSNKNTYVLTGTETPTDPRTYEKLYKKIITNSGVKYRKFHAIRHTFATRALEVGVDIKTLSEILGHTNVSITLNIYAHSLMEQKKIAIDKLNNLHIAHMGSATFAV